jgi:hypothetical protein
MVSNMACAFDGRPLSVVGKYLMPRVCIPALRRASTGLISPLFLQWYGILKSTVFDFCDVVNDDFDASASYAMLVDLDHQHLSRSATVPVR